MPSPTLSSEAVQADSTPVTYVRVVVHTLGPAGPNTSDNHWSIYLLYPDGVSSTRINMRAEFDDPTGILEWTKHGYTQTTSAIRVWDFPAAGGVTHRDRYEMLGGGSGCRWWVYNIISDMAQRNYVNQAAPTELWPHLLYLYHTHREPRALHMVRREFR